MRQIYRNVPDPSAPELILEGGISEKLVGGSLIELSPDESFRGHVSNIGDWTQFYRVGANAFAVSEEAWENCMEMYYTITENDVELLSVVADGTDFRVIHPRQFLPPSEGPKQICDLTYTGSIFRIQGCSPQEV